MMTVDFNACRGWECDTGDPSYKQLLLQTEGRSHSCFHFSSVYINLPPLTAQYLLDHVFAKFNDIYIT